MEEASTPAPAGSSQAVAGWPKASIAAAVLVAVTSLVALRQAQGPAAAGAADVAPMQEMTLSAPEPVVAAPETAVAVETAPESASTPEPAPVQPMIVPAPVVTTTPVLISKSGTASAVPEAPAPVAVPTTARRAASNYLVLLSTRDRKAAEAEAAKLEKAGVACTVEGALPGYSKAGWYSVVTRRGYDLPAEQVAFNRERARVTAMGLRPAAYRWR